MCYKCDTFTNEEFIADSVEAMKKELEVVEPGTEVMLFTIRTQPVEGGPEKLSSECKLFGALGQAGIAALMVELHLRGQDDPMVQDMFQHFLHLRTEQNAQKAAAQAVSEGPLDLAKVAKPSNLIH